MDQDRLGEVLLEWAERRREGRPVSPEELCAGRPELVEPLREEVRRVKAMEGFLGVDEPAPPEMPSALGGVPPAPPTRPDARARFLREARAAAAITHEHVVTIHHVGEEGDTPYLVMPLLEG